MTGIPTLANAGIPAAGAVRVDEIEKTLRYSAAFDAYDQGFGIDVLISTKQPEWHWSM
jgi:hypothetical protein